MSESEIPHLPSVESAVLGAVLAEGVGWWRRTQLICGDSPTSLFHVTQNKIVARAIENSINLSDEITDASVEDEMYKIGGDRMASSPAEIILGLQANAAISDLTALQKSVASLVQVRSARKMLFDIEAVARSIKEDGLVPQEISKKLQKASIANLAAKEVITMSDFIEELESDEGEPPFQIKTGLSELDALLGGGIEGGRNYVIAARPKIGKTTILINIIAEMLYDEDPPVIIFVSLETLNRDFYYKLMATMATLDQSQTKQVAYKKKTPEEAWTDPEDVEQFYEARDTLKDNNLYPIFPNDVPSGMTSLMSVVMSIIAKHPGRRVVLAVDYLQLLVQDKSNAYAEVSQMTRDFKLLAMEHELAVIYLSQLNRDGAGGEMPSPSMMRDSGSIEQDVDVAIMLNRKHEYDSSEPAHIMDVSVGLNRVGSSGDFQLNWDGARNLVVDAVKEDWGRGA